MEWKYRISTRVKTLISIGRDKEGNDHALVIPGEYRNRAELPILTTNGTIAYVKLPRFGGLEFTSIEDAEKCASRWIDIVLYREAHEILPDPDTDWEFRDTFEDCEWSDEKFCHDGEEATCFRSCTAFIMHGDGKDTYLEVFIFAIGKDEMSEWRA